MKRDKFFNFIPHPSSLIPALRGRVTLRAAALEALRRGRAALARSGEHRLLSRARGDDGAARLTPEFARLSASELLEHFRTRQRPRFPRGFADAEDAETLALASGDWFAAETLELTARAEEIVERGRWPLLGYGAREFSESPDWLRDAVSGVRWPLEYHADLRLVREDEGGDVRVVWELNRLGHLLTLGRAYAATADERFAEELLRQAAHWREHNPVGFGPNWACAMEVALRASNLLAAFQMVRRSLRLDEARLASLLSMFDEHGAHILRNLEYSYIATSNHYLSDVTGLFWLGVCLPELEAARSWREFGLVELLREMDKQVLADGADCEASTGYHRFVTELFLYSFILARGNDIAIDERHWQRLRSMLEYMRAYLRPDGRAPLVGDTDGGQFLPLNQRDADDHAYVLAVGAAAFKEPDLKPACGLPEEVFWLMGLEGARMFDSFSGVEEREAASRAFEEAGTYVMREGDLFMLFNASGAGLYGRGSHGHNDALGIEVSAGGACFIRDPGTYVYTSDLRERQRFRSTRYHSTVEVDGAEQNTTDERKPFRIGDEAHPRVLRWESDRARDLVVAEHEGYARLQAGAVTHRRAVLFDKREGFWLIEDALDGEGAHTFRFFFHLAPGVRASIKPDASLEVCDRITAARLYIIPLGHAGDATLEPRRSSRDYGASQESEAACWTIRAHVPFGARWALIPARAGEPEEERLKLAERLKEKLDTASLLESF
jgi:hypothetical protein